MLNGKLMIILLLDGLIKKILSKINQYFPKPYKNFRGNINVKVDLSNYAAKSDLKNATGVDTSKLAEKFDLASLKAEIDKINVDKLNTVPVDLSNLSNAVNSEVVKKFASDKLVAKVNNIATSGFVLNTEYDTDNSDLQKLMMQTKKFLILDTTGLANKADYDAKISQIECKVPSITGLVTTSPLTAVENKIPDVSKLVKKKAEYDTKTSESESKYLTTADYNKCTRNSVANQIKSKNVVDKSDMSRFIKNADLDKKLAILPAKAELKAEQDKILKLQAFDWSSFRGKCHFEKDCTQNYLVFQLIYRYFKKIGNTGYFIMEI